MATFVLVPGFWLGGWAWRDVAEPLRAAGHCVYPVTLTGLGERVQLGGPQVNLDTHIADVVNLLRYEQLHEVVLVGHSYAGTVITGVADQAPERIAQLVYVDTWPLPDGVVRRVGHAARRNGRSARHRGCREDRLRPAPLQGL